MKDLGSEQLPTNADKNPWDEPTADGCSPADKVTGMKQRQGTPLHDVDPEPLQNMSQKRRWEQQQQEQVDDDYERAANVNRS